MNRGVGANMHWKALTAAAFAVMMLAPGGHAISITIDEESPITLGAGNSTALPFTITLDCVEDIILSGAAADFGEYTATITPTGPSWLALAPMEMTIDGSACLTAIPSATISAGGSIDLTPNATAPGMSLETLMLDADGAMASVDVQVEYVPGYEFVVDGTFPMELGHDGESFGGVIHQFGNARSMAMFEIIDAGDCVTVTGLPEFYVADDSELAGDLESEVPVTLTATPKCEEWTESSFTFKTWSHFLDDGAAKTDDMEITWTFTPAEHEHEEESEDSPGAGVLLGALGLLGAAFVIARRR